MTLSVGLKQSVSSPAQVAERYLKWLWNGSVRITINKSESTETIMITNGGRSKTRLINLVGLPFRAAPRDGDNSSEWALARVANEQYPENRMIRS